MSNVIFKLSMTVVLVIVGILQTQALDSGNSLEIWPNLTSYTITPDTPEESRTLTCKGSEPIQWYFRQYDGTLQTKKNFSIKVFLTGENNYTYLAMLSLNKATYLDTGYYICAPSEELFYHKDIYIYIYHATHLLAIPEDFKLMYDLKYGTVIVPSHPTSAKVNVSMISNYQHSVDSFDDEVETCHPIRHFRCRNEGYDICLPDFAVCNGHSDCIDNSDEDETMCNAGNCSSPQRFRCTENSRCLSKLNICDGVRNCNDGSDEEKTMCQARTCPLYNPFKCANGFQCLSEWDVCDGQINCKDGSDEDNTTCQEFKMCNMTSQFKCTDFESRRMLSDTDHQSCVPSLQMVCDGYRDCSDGSDEDPKMCQAQTCIQETQFRCKSGLCIDSQDVCNGIRDCEDASDEGKNMCEARTCIQETQFRCKSGQCKDSQNVCDGTKDCQDESDEEKNMCENLAQGKIQFIERNGFQIDLLPFINISFTSIAHGKNHLTEERRIPNPFEDLVHIEDSSSGLVLIDQHITLNCSIEPIVGSLFWRLIWRVPVKWENKTQNQRIEYESYVNGTLLLHIKNVSTDDVGDYICIATAINGLNYTKTYKLNAYPHDINYTNLKIDDGVQKKIRPAGYEIVRWKVIMSSIGNTRLEWRKPNGHILETESTNTCVNNNCISELTVRNLKLSDSGIYKLDAYNGVELNEINVTLIVEEKPTVLFIKGLKSSQSYYDFGENYMFVFYISGYPLPSVECDFKKCPNYPKCEQSHSESKRFESDIIKVSKIIIKLVISMKIIDSGTLICNASNILGNHSQQHTIMVTGPRVPIINNSSDTERTIFANYGEQIILKCSAIGMPHPTISWYQDGQLWPLERNYSRMLMQNGHQTLLVSFTEIENERTYKCNASNQIGNVVLSYTLKVKNTTNENQTADVILFCSVIVILLGILLIGCVIGLNKEKTTINTMAVLEMYRLEEGAIIHENPNMGILFRWSFPLEKLELGKRLGSGAFGVVYKAKAEGIIHKNIISDVAVKTVNANTDSYSINALESELKMMINIGKHLNIVNLLGLCTGHNVEKKLMIIVEYCRYGSIDVYMRKHREYFVNQFNSHEFTNFGDVPSSKNPVYENVQNDTNKTKTTEDNGNILESADFLSNDELNTEGNSNNDRNTNNRTKKLLRTLDLIQWSYQIAKGMDFLASKNILHGDLAARNILLADNNIVKICDFGLSKSLSNSGVYKKKRKKDLLPIKWLAIESMNDLVFSTQSDVWSFGIVMWEMFSLAATPYPNLQLCDLYDKLVDGYRMERPKYADSTMYDMMMDCWDADPHRRPSFSDLFNRLGDLLELCTESDYSNFNDISTGTFAGTDTVGPVAVPTYSNCFITSETS